MNPQPAPYDIQLKLLLIGDSGVGKTCLLNRCANDSFSPSFITTIGIDFKTKNVSIDDCRIKLQMWDTAGQERFRTITNTYYRGAHSILLVYDVTDRSSFDSIRNWISSIRQHVNEDNVSVALIGNKCDLVDEKLVSADEGEKMASEFGIPFWECSAKNSGSVEEAFLAMAKSAKDRIVVENQHLPTSGFRRLRPPETHTKKKCC